MGLCRNFWILNNTKMNWTRSWYRLADSYKSAIENSKLGSSLYYATKDYQDVIFRAEKVRFLNGLQSQIGCLPVPSMDLTHNGSEAGTKAFKLKQNMLIQSRQFGRTAENDPSLDRNFLVKLWVADKKMRNSIRKRRRKVAKYGHGGALTLDNQSPYLNSLGRLFSGASVTGEDLSAQSKQVRKQPPLSQSMTGFLKPESPEEAFIAPLLARSNLLITRDIEWANLVLGFEQENRYAIVDVCYPQSPVGLIREQSNVIARQLLRLRRPFVAYITDAMGNELFKVRRPFWWITSSIYAEINGKEVGVVHRRWHLWRRVYDLYLGNKQFAVVENPGFWNWTFTLKDIDGKVLAEIDRDWRGFGFEIFTDAGQYVIRFGSSDSSSKTGPARMIQELEVARPLTLSERAVTVALAISLDNDYFSRHGGWGLPFIAVGE